MANDTEPPEAAAVSPDPDRLFTAAREARNDAAPFALAAAGILVALALVSRHAHWDLLGHRFWWIWLLVAAPYICPSATLLLGLGRLVRHDRRREIVIALLALVWVFNVLAVVVLVFSLVFHSAVHITGRQLLFSGAAAWLTDAIAFGLAFWELDCGGPVARSLATAPRKPDFQFPQDENARLAREGWAPRLWDYFYVSLTNATAFSPTDAMPLTRPAKALMAAESTLSAITVLLVAAAPANRPPPSQGGGRSLAVASGRNAPPYHGTSQATGGSRRQRIWLVFAISRGSRFAGDCGRLQPRHSIKAPYAFADRAGSFADIKERHE